MSNSIRERTVMEIIRRLKAQEFLAVNWGKIIRSDVPDDYDESQGSLLSVTEGTENFGFNTQKGENSFSLLLTFAIPLAAGEVAAAVTNNVIAEIVKGLSGNHHLEEGGAGSGGEKLTTQIYATSANSEMTDRDMLAAATVEFDIRYRTRTHDPFRLS